jgi:hypothetical protein
MLFVPFIVIAVDNRFFLFPQVLEIGLHCLFIVPGTVVDTNKFQTSWTCLLASA